MLFPPLAASPHLLRAQCCSFGLIRFRSRRLSAHFVCGNYVVFFFAASAAMGSYADIVAEWGLGGDPDTQGDADGLRGDDEDVDDGGLPGVPSLTACMDDMVVDEGEEDFFKACPYFLEKAKDLTGFGTGTPSWVGPYAATLPLDLSVAWDALWYAFVAGDTDSAYWIVWEAWLAVMFSVCLSTERPHFLYETTVPCIGACSKYARFALARTDPSPKWEGSPFQDILDFGAQPHPTCLRGQGLQFGCHCNQLREPPPLQILCRAGTLGAEDRWMAVSCC